MKLCLKILAIAVIAATTCSMIGCGAPPAYSYSNVTVTLSARCDNCFGGGTTGNLVPTDPAHPGVIEIANSATEGGNYEMTANVTNAPSTQVSWAVYPVGGGGGALAVTSTNTALFSGGNLGVYSGTVLAQAQAMQYTIQIPSTSTSGVTTYTTEQETGIPQGDVLLAASVPNNPDDPTSMVTAYQLFEYTGISPILYLTPSTPTNPSGLTTSVLTLPVGATYQFYGGAFNGLGCSPPPGSSTCTDGSPAFTTNNTVFWQVGQTGGGLTSATTGGSPTYGTISPTGLYTAPATVPAAQPFVAIVSQVAPGENKIAYITIVPAP